MHLTKRPQFRRLIAIDSALRQQSFPTANDLARAVEVNPKTVRRDLDYLRDQLGAPVEFSREHNGWFYSNCSITPRSARGPAALVAGVD